MTSSPEIRRPPAVPLFPLYWRSLRDFDTPNKALLRHFQKYGDIVWLRIPGRKPMYLVSNPAYIKHFLVDNAADNYPKNFMVGVRSVVLGESLTSSDGAFWRRHRRMMQPAFQRDRVLAMAPKMVSAISRLFDERWEAFARATEPVAFLAEMSRVVVSVLGQIIHSEDPPQDVRDAVGVYMQNSIRPRTLVEEFVPMTPWMAKRHLTYTQPKVRPAAHRINDYAWEVTRRRLAMAEQPDDMLGVLINGRDEKGEGMSELEVRNEFVELFYGGHVSTSISLAFLFYCLAENAPVAERVRETVDRVLGGRLPTAADLPALQYLSQVFDETIRLHPPAPGVARPAMRADTLGGYDVPAGTMLVASSYVMHRHPDYWPDAEKFDPERFAPEQARARNRFTYIPFGAGQRVCIGAQLASMIAVLASAMITQRYQVTLAPDHRVLPLSGGAYYPENLWMRVRPVQPREPGVAAAAG